VTKAVRAASGGRRTPKLDAMPRPPRPQFAGGLYNVGSRGVRRTPIYLTHEHYATFERILTDVVQRFGWRCHTQCLMPNHYHLLVETPAPNLSAGMQQLNGKYGQWFNAKHDLCGHVFERRFYSKVVESMYHLLELSRYIVLNPVRAGLCNEPGDWPGSSYRALVGEAPPPPFLTTGWLLGMFGDDPRRAREAFRTFVLDAPRRALRT
jgi:putative transposase